MSLRPLVELIQHTREFAAAQQALQSRGLPPLQVMRSARPLVAAALANNPAKPALYIASSVDASRTAFDALRLYRGAENLLRFAEPNTAFYDSVPPVRDVIAQRSSALATVSRATGDTVVPFIVASPRSLMQAVAPRPQFAASVRVILQDSALNLESLLSHCISLGYEPDTVVERVGAFSRRGGIIDLWSPAHDAPIRIELFGDEVDSLRSFDPGTQRSGARVRKLVISPLDQGSAGASSLIDHFAEGLVFVDDETELAAAWADLETRAERERESAQADAGNKPYLAWTEIARVLQARNTIVLGQPDAPPPLSRSELANLFKAPPHFGGQLTPLIDALDKRTTEKLSGIVVSRQAGRLADVWSSKHGTTVAQNEMLGMGDLALSLAPAPQTTATVQFIAAALAGGYEVQLGQTNLLVLSDSELFGYVRPQPSHYGKAHKAAPERAFADWSPGDAVVHEDYGLGLYRGLVKLSVSTAPNVRVENSEDLVEREYILLEFAEANKLYVPLHNVDRISRYVGSEDAQPVLTKLHSGEWESTRKKARGAAAEVAREMLKLYAERELAQGHTFGQDTQWQTELEASFPYVETDDQLNAIEAVKADMMRAKPMDRLVCGDVGFGKTEVALRAAFKAVQDGKQVAVLVPTTVLAQQHFNTFVRRLGSYPIKIEMLSRFRTAAEKRAVHVMMAGGEVDIVIGTHGLVSEGVQFKDLGLLIIDEEQRFGIKDKDRLKKLRTNVDVLTLTATPIPRTLYLGLSGVRDVSRIETPPVDRLPIITHVGPSEDHTIQQAIRRELDRDGQVFVVHNRVQTLGFVAQRIQKLVPEATLAIAHGQMEERKLAKAMNDFGDGQYQVLLCTNIIESGLDIPNANTIIIDRADMFGLGELYQLRGRVGRSNVQAYAYFLHERRARLTDESRDRLETMREAKGIGAGYMIAMRDLELRGAGDMLGSKQSGQVHSIGLDLYTRLLSREISVLRALRDGTAPPPPEARPLTIDLPLTVGLPESYIPDAMLRVQMYRRVASLDSEIKIQAFEEELDDRFGPRPGAAKNLTFQARLKLHAEKFGAQSITSEGNRFTVRADLIEKMNSAALRILLGEDGNIGRKQISWLRSGTADQWKKKLMDVVEWMTKQ